MNPLSRHIVPLVCTLGFLLVIPPQPARAAWTPGGVSTSPVESGVAYLPDGSGGLLTVGTLPYRYDSTATRLWFVNNLFVLGTSNLAATTDGAGGAIAVASSTNDFDLRINRITAGGTRPWGNALVICNAVGTQDYPAICSDGAGGAIFAWEDSRDPSGPDVYVQRVNGSGVAQWTANGLPVCTQPGLQFAIRIVSDGSGGAILTWDDLRPGAVDGRDVFAQRVDGAGNMLWAADGIPVTAGGVQARPAIVSDGAGGAILGWTDSQGVGFEILAQRLDASGTPQWAGGGVPVIQAPFDQDQVVMISDGAGGAFFAWEDFRSGTQRDIYLQRLSGSGSQMWAAQGVPACAESHEQVHPRLIGDGQGGVEVCWSDARSGPTAYDVFVHRFDGGGAQVWSDAAWVAKGLPLFWSTRKGFAPDWDGGCYVMGPGPAAHRVDRLGNVMWESSYRAPWIGIKDVPADQGGWVRLEVSRPFADAVQTGFTAITAYSVWRRIAASAGAEASGPPLESAARDAIARALHAPTRLDAVTAATAGFPPGSWELISSLPAMRLETYAFAAPTHDDSTAAGPADDVFVVVSHTADANLWVSGFPDSGHSVDNIPPGIPQALSGAMTAPTTVQLDWLPNGERDFAAYAIHKGTSPGFSPSTENRLGTPSTPGFTDPAFDPATSHYKVLAHDQHGNASGAALLSPDQVTSVGPPNIPAVSFLGKPVPNPARGTTAIEYGSARDGHIDLRVLDLNGRLVRVLVDEVAKAGVRRVMWDGRDGNGRRIGPGVYWLSFVAPGARSAERVVWIE